MKEEDKFKYLKKISKPIDIKKIKDLDALCSEIREKIISIVSRNGGHLASNLGVVELSVALHKVFCEENDKIVWDVGHQCYAHKMLTGRFDKMDSIRTEGGLSGFTNRFESKFDVFTSGHSSTAISSALGIAYSNYMKGQDGHTIAVIGDGALTGGLAYEGLNNAGKFKKNFIVVLNDNKMSISHNVGAISRYLTYVRIRPSYVRIKGAVERVLMRIPFIGIHIINILRKIKSIFKDFFYSKTIFEDMGFLYYGPVDGHNIKKMLEVFKRVKEFNQPVLVHVVTTKGKGYKFAEKNPKDFHGMPKFNIETGESGVNKESFSNVFGEELCSISEKDRRVCAITAAMKSGTGLNGFSKKYKNRFFDVGIAEEHAITFASGLAVGGMVPVVAIYSSFLQRGYDQMIHDIAIQRVKVVFAIDRAGLTGDDGETHQGIFDVAFLNSVPNIKIFAPSFFDELKLMLNDAISKSAGTCAVRYPRGKEFYKPNYFEYREEDFNLIEDKPSKILLITYGRIFSNTCLAKESLFKDKNISCSILKLNIIKPINYGAIKIALKYKFVFFFEESSKLGGTGQIFGEQLLENEFKGKYLHFAVDNPFVKHADVESQIKKCHLDCSSIASKIIMEISK